ncbi:MAG: LemA family protein [bacterium]
MSKGMKIFLGIMAVLVILVIGAYASIKGTYNSLVSLDEGVNGAWSQVQNVYQRRADLIPNLVQTVKGYAAHEKETLEAVIQARASATRPQINAREVLQNPQLFRQFEQAQGQLTSALGRLMVVIERYPDLKANTNFIRLQDELAGTENRIAVERRRFNESVQGYNQTVRSFPTMIFAGVFGFQQRQYFEASPEAQQAPEVDFSTNNN